MLVSNTTLYNIFSYTLFNVLIDAIQPNVEKKLKTCVFYATVGREVRRVQNKTKYISFRVRVFNGNQNIIQKLRNI